MPVFPGLRRFGNGITFKQWTGDHTRALLVILLAALYDLTGTNRDGVDATITDKVVQVYSLLAIFILLTRSFESSPQDRSVMRRIYSIIVERLQEDGLFAVATIVAAERSKRFHSIYHTTQLLARDGAAPHSDTSTGERLHSQTVKNPYRASNHLHATTQILRANSRRDALSLIEARIAERDKSSALPPAPTALPEWCISMALHGTAHGRARTPIGKLATLHHLPSLSTLLHAFLARAYDMVIDIDDVQALNAYVHNIVAADFPVYPSPSFLTADTAATMHLPIYATETYSYRSVEGLKGRRYDPVLLSNGQPLSKGWKAVEVARVRLFFSVLLHGREVQLAVVEEYEKGGVIPALKQPMVKKKRQVDGTAIFRIVPISSILRPIHLQPLFRDLPISSLSEFHTILDTWTGEFVLSIFSDQAIFRLLAYSLI
ncbi:hypothetical protein JCM11641_006660 [Rhodosporidiobolus odoratus]